MKIWHPKLANVYTERKPDSNVSLLAYMERPAPKVGWQVEITKLPPSFPKRKTIKQRLVRKPKQ